LEINDHKNVKIIALSHVTGLGAIKDDIIAKECYLRALKSKINFTYSEFSQFQSLYADKSFLQSVEKTAISNESWYILEYFGLYFRSIKDWDNSLNYFRAALSHGRYTYAPYLFDICW